MVRLQRSSHGRITLLDYDLAAICRTHLDRIPDQTTILNFRLLLEKHELAGGILQVIVDQLLHGEGAYVIGDAGLIRKSGFASWLKIARNRPRYLPCRTFG